MSLNNEGNLKILKTNVLIVGAGPSGLMAAQALGRLGVDVTVVERRIPGEAYGNADGLQPRTLEIWKTYGMLETIDSKGARMIGMVAYEASDDDRSLVRSRPSNNVVVPGRYPYEITASISDIEGTLRKNAENAHVKFLYNSWPVSLSVLDTEHSSSSAEFPVKMLIRNGSMRGGVGKPTCHIIDDSGSDQLEEISTKYVIGADGAYSWVRRAIDIDMEGEQAEDVWGVVDILANTDFPDMRFKCVVQRSSGPLIVVPREGDKVRIYVQMSTADKVPRREDGRVDKSAFDPNEMQKKILQNIQDRLSPYKMEITHVFWSTIFATSQKVASSFSNKNRIFIAGDACHTHSPKAGQGANASMGDTHNLAWKLAYVLKGWASPSILATYEQERREYSLNLISFDREISSSLEGRAAADYQAILHKQNMFTSGMGISYSTSVLTVGSTKYGTVSPGERFPFAPIIRIADWHPFDIQDLLLSDGRFKLIVLPGYLIHPPSQTSYAGLRHQFGIASKFIPQDWRRVVRESVRGYQYILWRATPKKTSPGGKCLLILLKVGDGQWCYLLQAKTFDCTPNSCYTVRDCASEDMAENIYKQFGLTFSMQPPATPSAAAAVLVRPDGHISMITGLEPADAERIVLFLCNL